MIFFQTRFVLSALAAAALSLGAVQAHATGGHHHPKPPKPPKHDDCGPTDPCEETTKLTFTKLLDAETKIERENTVGGDLTITANGGKLVVIGGELGVSSKKSPLDVRIGSGETVIFTFEEAVELTKWDLDDLWGGSNKFTLSVDGGAAAQFSLDSNGPSTDLIGKVFTFGYKNDSYFIDSLTFKGYCPPVPEPETYGLALAGLLVAGVALRRKGA